METFKRVLTAIVIAISSLGLILCLVGIIGTWSVNKPLTDNLTDTLDRVETVLVFSQKRLSLVDENMTAVQSILANLDETVTQAENQLSKNSPTLNLLSNTVGKELMPKIESAAEVISTLRGTIISINDTLVAANSIPFVTVPTLPMEQLSAIDRQLQEMVTTVESLAETVIEVEAGIIQGVAASILTPVERLTVLVDQIHTPVKQVKEVLAQIESSVVNLSARIPALIDWASVLITLILVWFIIAQASLLYGGWYYWKTGEIPAIQIQSSSNTSGG